MKIFRNARLKGDKTVKDIYVVDGKIVKISDKPDITE